MSERVRETDFRGLLKSFLKMDEEEYQSDDISVEDAIKICNEVTEKEKEELLSAVMHSSELEAILDYSKKSKNKMSIPKISRNVKKQEKNVEENEIKGKAQVEIEQDERDNS